MRISCDYQLLDTNGCIKVNGHWNLGLSSLIGSLYSKTTAKCFFNNATPSSLYSSLKVAIMNGMNNLFLTGQTKKGSTSLSNLLHVLTLTTYEHEKVKLGIGDNFSLLLLGKKWMLFGYDNGRKLVSETRFCLSPRSQKRSSSAPIFINSFFGTRNPHGSNRYFKLTFRDPVERRLNPVFEECILHILERFARYREEVLKEMKNPILSSVQIGNEQDGQIDIVLSNKEIPDYKDWDDCYVDDGLYVYTRAKNESYLQKVFAERFDELFNGDDK